MNTKDAFKSNLPIFEVKVRGNVVADSTLTKTGRCAFRLAYSPGRGEDAIFIGVVVMNEVAIIHVEKGDYVEVEGDYREEIVKNERGTFVNRTIFSRSGRVLGTKAF